MISRFLSLSAPLEHAEPAQRVLGAAQLPPDSPKLARLLAVDPAPEVRAAAARRCADLAALAAAWQTEADAAVRDAIASALGNTPITVYGDGSQTRDFTFIDDVVAANLAAAARTVTCSGACAPDSTVTANVTVNFATLFPIMLPGLQGPFPLRSQAVMRFE